MALLSNQQIESFMHIYKRRLNKDISFAVAQEKAIQLLMFQRAKTVGNREYAINQQILDKYKEINCKYTKRKKSLKTETEVKINL